MACSTPFPDRLAVALVGLIGLYASQAAAEPAPPLSAEREAQLLALGEDLFERGLFYRAISSFEELRLLSSRPQVALQAHLRIALSYHRSLQLDEAVREYDALLARPGLPSVTAGLVRLSRAQIRAEAHWRGLRPVAEGDLVADVAPLAASDDPGYATYARYHLVRLHLAEGREAPAREEYRRAGDRCRASLQPGCEWLPSLEQALALPGPRRRSPLLAAALSAAIPGLGAVYTEHPVDAVYYFVLTVGSALLALDIHDRQQGLGEQRASFYVLGSLSALFYSASVLQGYASARRFNEVARHDHRRQILQTTERPPALPLVQLPPK